MIKSDMWMEATQKLQITKVHTTDVRLCIQNQTEVKIKLKKRWKSGRRNHTKSEKDNACNQIDNVRVKLLRNNSQVDRP